MTPQEIFDKTVTHLRTQGKKSLNPKFGTCAYRGADDMKCAFGIFITDEEYSINLEGADLKRLLRNPYIPESLQDRLDDNFDLYFALQCVHDHESPPYWEGQLELVAKEFNLVYTTP